MTMGRAPCCDEKVALKKGPWTPDEDQKLVVYIQHNGHGSWRSLPEKAGLARCGKSCRLRWTNYLRPDIKRGRFSNEEDDMIIKLHSILGNRWSAIASHLPRRTDNEIKNYWNTHLKKRLAQMGIDPVTHKTSTAGLNLSPAWTPLVSTQLTHTTQWHCALAEAEARLTNSSSPSLLTEQLQRSSAAVPHPSAFFMRSWKTKVEDTLKPRFGTVKLESPRVRIDYSSSPVSTSVTRPQKFLPDWNTALGIQPTFLEKFSSPFLEKPPAMAMKNESSLLVDMFDTEIPPSDRVENPFTSSFSTSEVGVGLENHFSPTSILSGPDSDSCSGSGDSDCFEFLHHGSGSYQNFPLIEGEYEHAQSVSMRLDSISESFWQGGQQGALMQASDGLLEDFKDGDSEAGCLEMIMPLDFDNGSQFDPHF